MSIIWFDPTSSLKQYLEKVADIPLNNAKSKYAESEYIVSWDLCGSTCTDNFIIKISNENQNWHVIDIKELNLVLHDTILPNK